MWEAKYFVIEALFKHFTTKVLSHHKLCNEIPSPAILL